MARLEIKLKEMELRVETREGEERKVICFTLFFFVISCGNLNRDGISSTLLVLVRIKLKELQLQKNH